MKKWVHGIIIAMLVFTQFGTYVSSAKKCSWMCYGGDAAGTNTAPDECAPVGPNLGVQWDINIDAPILSQPAIDDGKIYFGTFKNVFYCLDLSTGKVVWSPTIGGSVYSTPCIDGSSVYICSWDRKAYCFDKYSGSKKWSFGTELYIFNSPMLFNGWMFIGSRDEKLYCVNPQTGMKFWDIKVGPVTSTPIVGNNMIYIGEHEGSVYCVDPFKQSVAWEYKTDGIIESSIAYSNGKIFLGYTGESNSYFTCIDAKQGKPEWVFKCESGLWSDPCVGDGKCYVSVENNLYALDEKKGTLLWTDKLETGRYSQALYCKNRVYVGTTKDGFIVKNSDTGETVFNLPVKSAVRTPAIAEKKILFGCEDGSVYCLGGEEEKIVSVAISPESITIVPNASTSFSLSGSMNTGAIVDITKEALWTVKDTKIGKVDNDGKFTATNPGTTQITATYKGMVAEAKVTVRHSIRVSPNPLVFKNIPFGSKAKAELNIENLVDKQLSCKFTASDPARLIFDSTNLTVPTDGAKMPLSFDSTSLEPGSKNNYTIKIEYDGGWMELPVEVTISTDQVQCIKFEPYMLDFGYLSRGSTKTLEFLIHYSGIKVKGKLKPMQNWIDVSPEAFSSDNPEQIFKVTISASALPSGDTFGGSIRLESEEPMCQQTSINVMIKTDKGIVIKLEIENKNATINDQKAVLDVPAKLINGRTMVPIRFISESFGCKVNWDAKAKEITIIRHDMSFKLWLGKNYAMVGDKKQPLDSPPVIVEGRTLVPLRFISEPFGAVVNWDAKTKKITVVWDPN